MKKLSILIVSTALAACGGGGGGSTNEVQKPLYTIDSIKGIWAGATSGTDLIPLTIVSSDGKIVQIEYEVTNSWNNLLSKNQVTYKPYFLTDASATINQNGDISGNADNYSVLTASWDKITANFSGKFTSQNTIEITADKKSVLNNVSNDYYSSNEIVSELTTKMLQFSLNGALGASVGPFSAVFQKNSTSGKNEISVLNSSCLYRGEIIVDDANPKVIKSNMVNISTTGRCFYPSIIGTSIIDKKNNIMTFYAKPSQSAFGIIGVGGKSAISD